MKLEHVTQNMVDRWEALEHEARLLIGEKINGVRINSYDLLPIEKAFKPLQPETYSGLTVDEWKRVFVEKFDIHYNGSESIKFKTLTTDDLRQIFNKTYTPSLRREIGHIQPYFPRLGKPKIHNRDLVYLIYWSGVGDRVYSAGSIDWDDTEIKAFIQITDGKK